MAENKAYEEDETKETELVETENIETDSVSDDTSTDLQKEIDAVTEQVEDADINNYLTGIVDSAINEIDTFGGHSSIS